MAFLQIYGIGVLIILGFMTILWIVSLILRNSSIVDIFWGTGFVIANWVYFALTPDGFPARKWLIVTLVTIWGLRLSLYILWRNWGKGEDFRYQKWREEAGGKMVVAEFLQGLSAARALAVDYLCAAAGSADQRHTGQADHP